MPAGKATWAWRGPGKDWWSAVLDPSKPKLNVMDYMGPNRNFLRHCGKEIIRAYRGESTFKVIFSKKGKGSPHRTGTYFTGLKKRKSPTGVTHLPLADTTVMVRKQKKKLGLIPTARNRTFVLRETDKHLLDGFGSSIEYKPTQVIVGWEDKESRRRAALHQEGFTQEIKPDAKSTDVLESMLGQMLSQLALYGTPSQDITTLKMMAQKVKGLARLRTAISKGEASFTYRGKVIRLVPERGTKDIAAYSRRQYGKALNAMGFRLGEGYASKQLMLYATGKVAYSDIWRETLLRYVPLEAGRKTTARRTKEGLKFRKRATREAWETAVTLKGIKKNDLLRLHNEFVGDFLADQQKLLKRFGVRFDIGMFEAGGGGGGLDAMMSSAIEDIDPQIAAHIRGERGKWIPRTQADILSQKGYGITREEEQVPGKPGLKLARIKISTPARQHYGFSKQLMQSLSAMGTAWLERGFK